MLLPLFSRTPLHARLVLNLFLPGTGPERQDDDPPPVALSEEIESIVKAYNKDCSQNEESFKARHGRKLRTTLAALAKIKFREAGSTDRERLESITREGGAWYQALRCATQEVIYILFLSFLKLEYKDRA
jgi:hypothetical protein